MSRAEILDSLLERISDRGDKYQYFFDQLDNPEWIAPLREKGFFKHPPSIEEVEGGYMRLPIWPESQALARMADRSGPEVLAAIRAADPTNNSRVHSDYIDAALAMDPELSGALVSSLDEWLDAPFLLTVPIKAGGLLEHLAIGRQRAPALTLTETLLKLNVRDGRSLGTRVQARIEEYDYKTVLEDHVPALVAEFPLDGVALLVTTLETALQEEFPDGGPHDYSYIWKADVRASGDEDNRGPREHLVTGIRQALELTARVAPDSLEDAMELALEGGWDVLTRVAMYATRELAPRNTTLSRRLLMNPDLLYSFEVAFEYGLLAETGFEVLVDADQESLLALIDEGPPLDLEMPLDPELRQRREHWRWERIVHIPDGALSPTWRKRKARLVAEFGSEAEPPFEVKATFVGHSSPISEDEAKSMSVEQLATLAADIPDTTDRFASEEEGFAMLLERLAEDSPTRFSSGIHSFLELKPLYTRSLFAGLGKAAKAQDSDIDWQPVLEAASWVLSQPRTREGGSGGSYSDLDPGWTWTVKGIADLLDDALRARTIGAAFRDQVWKLLTRLLNEPLGRSEDGQEEHRQDAATDSLNVTRGRAMHAVFAYAYWVYDFDKDDGWTLSTRAPELIAVLDRHLDPNYESSKAVRAAYGMHLAMLYSLDIQWVRSRAPVLFPQGEDGDFSALGFAAWSAYLKYSQRSLPLMEALNAQYEEAVTHVGAWTGGRSEPADDLTEHVLTMYWHGVRGDSPASDQLLELLWLRLTPEQRINGLQFVGRSTRKAAKPLDQRVLDRLVRLWDWEVTGAEGSPERREELASIGWWVTSDAFEPTWAFSTLQDAVRIAKSLDLEELVAKWLVDKADDHLDAAIRVLRQMVEILNGAWSVYGWRSEAMVLVEKGLVGSATARDAAHNVANLLTARGFREFRDVAERP